MLPRNRFDSGLLQTPGLALGWAVAIALAGCGDANETGGPADASDPVDAGDQAPQDLGPDLGPGISPDAGATPADAGAPADAGEADAGAPSPDAGITPDAGMMMAALCPPEAPFGSTVGSVFPDIQLPDCDGVMHSLHDACARKAVYLFVYDDW